MTPLLAGCGWGGLPCILADGLAAFKPFQRLCLPPHRHLGPSALLCPFEASTLANIESALRSRFFLDSSLRSVQYQKHVLSVSSSSLEEVQVMLRSLRRMRGFTLIELLVVI